MSRVEDPYADREIKEIRVCEVCNKDDVVFCEARLAEVEPFEDESDSGDPIYTKSYVAIGILFIHIDGRLCNKDLYRLERV